MTQCKTILRSNNDDYDRVFQNIDGINQWEALSQDLKSERCSILHNIDDIWGNAALTVDEWKLVKGTNYNGAWDGWYNSNKRSDDYQVDLVTSSHAGKAIAKLGLMPGKDDILKVREAATVSCDPNIVPIECNPLVAPCLFNIQDDPCEKRNLAEKEPEILQRMLTELAEVNKTAIPPNNMPDDPRGDPKHWGRVFFNFGDFELSNPNSIDL